ncbi:MAG: efflux RND transporter periplasmic adaptor subunit [Planctomycetes bacterium]|nr:efflux RND transporter periplasmic adaptor subunit [Planctomycetota bacterium]
MSEKTTVNRRWILVPALLGMAILAFFVLPDSWLYRAPAKGENRHAHDTRFACPMFCVVMDVMPSDERCPVCGMKLDAVKVTSEIDQHERGMIGLQAHALETVPLARELLLTGEVDYDESRITVITTRAAGWIEALPKKVTWETVQEDEVLFEFYAPEVFAAQQEYLVARQSGSPAVLGAARERLENLGVGPTEIAALETAGRPVRRVAYRSPRSGLIVRRGAEEGAHVPAGAEIFVIADLGRVWLQLEVFENDLPWLAVGGRVTVSSESESEGDFEGRIVFIDPVVDRTTRTARVRIEVENKRHATRGWVFVPGQRVSCAARVPLDGEGRPAAALVEPVPVLAVPRAAVLRTGRRSVVFVLYVDQADGERNYDLDPKKWPSLVGYELVELELGPLARRTDRDGLAEFYPIRSVKAPLEGPGLKTLRPGLLVAVKGALLLDSQAQISGRPSLLFPEGRVPSSTEGR